MANIKRKERIKEDSRFLRISPEKHSTPPITRPGTSALTLMLSSNTGNDQSPFILNKVSGAQPILPPLTTTF